MVKPCLYKVVPATQEAEAGGSPEPWEVEAAVSCDCTTVLQPEWQSENNKKKKKRKKNKKKKELEVDSTHSS